MDGGWGGGRKEISQTNGEREGHAHRHAHAHTHTHTFRQTETEELPVLLMDNTDKDKIQMPGACEPVKGNLL